MNDSAMKWLQGWRLLSVAAVALMAMIGIILALSPDVDGVRRVIRATARSSLILFCLAVTAAAAWRVWPGDLSRWQLRNRRYVGLSFALSHSFHLVAIIAFATLDPLAFQAESPVANRFFGGLAYLLIFAMAATSFDRTAAWIGRDAWRRLHTVGVHYIGLVFLVSFGRRAIDNPNYWIGVLVLLCAFGLRWWAARPRPRTVLP